MNKIKKSKNYITIKISLQWISTNYSYNKNTAKMGQYERNEKRKPVGHSLHLPLKSCKSELAKTLFLDLSSSFSFLVFLSPSSSEKNPAKINMIKNTHYLWKP